MAKGRIFKWKKGSTFKVDAQTAGTFLENLKAENDGILQPDDVVEAAKDPESPIHDEFEWDLQKAANNHWKDRARNLMNHLAVVRVYAEDASEGVSAFVNVEVAQSTRGYVAMSQVVANDDWRQQMVDDVLNRLKALQKKYEQLDELDGVWAAIKKAETRRAKGSAAA
jgi:hypothetical protein